MSVSIPPCPQDIPAHPPLGFGPCYPSASGSSLSTQVFIKMSQPLQALLWVPPPPPHSCVISVAHSNLLFIYPSHFTACRLQRALIHPIPCSVPTAQGSAWQISSTITGQLQPGLGWRAGESLKFPQAQYQPGNLAGLRSHSPHPSPLVPSHWWLLAQDGPSHTGRPHPGCHGVCLHWHGLHGHRDVTG